MPDPIYTTLNCQAAYQLNWMLSIFWNEPVESSPWLDNLKEATEPDGVRILKHRFPQPGVSQFFISTKPEVSPRDFARSIKGRLQHLVREEMPKAFRRHYGFRSIGSATRDEVEQYVSNQLGHHQLADPKLQQQLKCFQIHNKDADLSQLRNSGHSAYWYNLHIVFVQENRYWEIREDRLKLFRNMIVRASEKHERILSYGSILPDHIHLVVGCDVKESPAEVTLSYMNNIAYALGMQAVFRCSYYAGTIGEYDRGAV